MTRAVRIVSPEARFDFRPDGSIGVVSPRTLGPYPASIVERLEHWAERAPDRRFLAERDPSGGWRGITYRETLERGRRVARGLAERGLSSERPVAILSGNSIDHALVALGAMYAGIPYAPISTAYSSAGTKYGALRSIGDSMRPGLVFAAGDAFAHAAREVFPYAEWASAAAGLEAGSAGAAKSAAGPDTVAKILFTSGSTGHPKGVINTHRMWCSNLEMITGVLEFLRDEPPVFCDWLPWNHTFGGNHNFGLALYNGGTLYLDSGKPAPGAFETTLANLREIAPTAYFNVPKGFEMLVPELRRDPDLARNFFSRLKIVFYAAAGLKQQVWDDVRDAALAACGEEILMITGLGSTECAPSVLFTGAEGASSGRVGLPLAGVEVKLAPVGEKLEIRVRGPNVTPGFWRNPELTSASFDDEGFYKMGDGLRFLDPSSPQAGFVFDGRITEDFKLSTGTWVSVGPLRAKFLTHFGDAALDVVIAAPDRDFVAALVFPNPRHAATTDDYRRLLNEFARQATGTSTRVVRIAVLDQPPSLEARELTDKGTINQKAVLSNRAHLVEALYTDPPGTDIIEIAPQ